MNLATFLRTVRQRWAVILACVVVAAAVTWVITPANSAERVTYTATATLVQTPSGAAPGTPTGQISLDTIALFVRTGEIPRRAANSLGEDDPAALASEIAVVTDPQSTSLTITARSVDGERAAAVANAFAEETVDFFRDQDLSRRNAEILALEERLVEISGVLAEAEAALARDPQNVVRQAERDAQLDRYEAAFAELEDLRAIPAVQAELAILQRATPEPVTSTGVFVAPAGRAARVAIAAALGLLLGLALAVALERSDMRIRSREDVLDVLQVPVVAEVPRMSRRQRKGTKIAILTDPLKAIAEAYRSARSALLLGVTHQIARPYAGGFGVATTAGSDNEGATPGVVLVASGHAREGKTTTAANVAASLAESGREVVVVDADFRAPSAHRYFDVSPGPGLSDHIEDPSGLPLPALLRPTNVPGVRLVTAGTRLDQPAVLPSKMSSAVSTLRGSVDVVVIDSAPMLHTNDALDIIPLTDAVLLVVRSGRLTGSAGRRIAELLSRFQAPVIGVVLIGSRAARPRGYGYYGYGYGESQRGSEAEAGKRRGRRSSEKRDARAGDAPATLAGASDMPWLERRSLRSGK